MDIAKGVNPNVGVNVIRVEETISNPITIPPDIPELDTAFIRQVDYNFSTLQHDMPLLTKEFWVSDPDAESGALYHMKYRWSASFAIGSFYLSYRALEAKIVNRSYHLQRQQSPKSASNCPLIKDILLSGNQLLIKIHPFKVLTKKEEAESDVQEKYFAEIMEAPLENRPLLGLKRRREMDVLTNMEERDTKRTKLSVPKGGSQ